MYNTRLTQSNTILKQFELTRYLILRRCLFFSLQFRTINYQKYIRHIISRQTVNSRLNSDQHPVQDLIDAN